MLFSLSATHDSSIQNALKPRLLVIVNVFKPDLGGGILFTDLCNGFAERGWDVSVKCAFSYYPEWQDKSGKNGIMIEESREHGLRIERHGLYIPGNPNSLPQRLLHEASFFLSLMRRRPSRGEYDLVMAFCPLIASVAYGVAASRFSHAPLWLNVQDLSAQAAVAGGLAGASARLMLWVQNTLFRRAHAWSSISGSMVGALRQIPGAPKHIFCLPNWLHADMARMLSLQSRTRAETHNPLRLLYSGNVGAKQDLLSFCMAMHHRSDAFEFRIHAGGARVEELRIWLNNIGDSRFLLHPLTSEEELADWLSWCDFYVITERQGAGHAFLPSTLIPAISAGAPILAVCDSDGPLGREVGQHDLGPLISWTDLDLDPIWKTRSDPARTVATWSNNAIRRSRFYTRESSLDRYVECAQAILERHSNRGTGFT